MFLSKEISLCEGESLGYLGNGRGSVALEALGVLFGKVGPCAGGQ